MKEKADVGVLVGRFQVDELHDAHHKLIQDVINKHEKVIIFLGLSPARVTRNNPLDFEARKQMILESYPDVIVLYIKDIGNNEKWSKQLDRQIEDIISPTSTVMLYGGRESFVEHYLGKFSTCEIIQESYSSGSLIRNKISNKVKSSKEFRAGVIWAAHNQYPKIYPTVDVAIWNKKKDELLMAKKPNQDLYRFVGGFAEGKTSFEDSVVKEVLEETHIEIENITYIGSSPIDDWRYRKEVDGIVTLFFEATHSFGKPNPDDDISELKWFKANSIFSKDIVPEHRVLLNMLRQKNKDIMNIETFFIFGIGKNENTFKKIKCPIFGLEGDLDQIIKTIHDRIDLIIDCFKEEQESNNLEKIYFTFGLGRDEETMKKIKFPIVELEEGEFNQIKESIHTRVDVLFECYKEEDY